jgi:nucleosome binding factor SPN SPT16 subunit
VHSDENYLTTETIYLNICGKYRDMNVMASRTLLINPDETQKQSYLLANEGLNVLIKNLVVGEPVKKAYDATKEFLKSKDGYLAGKTHTNFGFGVRINLNHFEYR